MSCRGSVRSGKCPVEGNVRSGMCPVEEVSVGDASVGDASAMHACMPACMPACLHARLSACLPACMYACMYEEKNTLLRTTRDKGVNDIDLRINPNLISPPMYED